MSNSIASIQFDNGITLTFLDETVHYYGGFHHVVVTALISCAVTPHLIPPDLPPEETRALAGTTVSRRTRLERMGVPMEQTAAVRDELMSAFRDSSSSYLAHPGFPERFIRSEIAARRKTARTHSPRFFTA